MIQTPSPPAVRAPALAVLFSVVFINLVGFGLVVPLLPFFAQSLKAEAWQITLMFSAYSLGQFFAEPFWGRLSDRIGRKPVLLATLAANTVGYLMLAFVPNIWLAIAVRLFTGGAKGAAAATSGCKLTSRIAWCQASVTLVGTTLRSPAAAAWNGVGRAIADNSGASAMQAAMVVSWGAMIWPPVAW